MGSSDMGFNHCLDNGSLFSPLGHSLRWRVTDTIFLSSERSCSISVEILRHRCVRIFYRKFLTGDRHQTATPRMPPANPTTLMGTGHLAGDVGSKRLVLPFFSLYGVGIYMKLTIFSKSFNSYVWKSARELQGQRAFNLGKDESIP